MAFDAETSSGASPPAANRSLAACWIPVTVVAHQGPVVTPLLQLRFATWVS